jgi:hypothetical protein
MMEGQQVKSFAPLEVRFFRSRNKKMERQNKVALQGNFPPPTSLIRTMNGQIKGLS